MKYTENINPANYYENMRSEMLEFLPDKFSRVLEAGCGIGTFSAYLKDNYQAEVWGIEPVASIAERATEKLDKVINSTIEEAIKELPHNYFDLIIFNDVLEHLADPFETLSELRKIISKGTIIVASIPNVRYATNLKHILIDKDWQYTPEGGILDSTHLRFFTQKSISRLVKPNEYNVKFITGINPIRKWQFNIINIATLGFFSDTRYLQFAVQFEAI
jgi:2-polyprenyl-3-methyl-5-hydroxy-6-metoxy-1,4-benzoquinol methylase